MFNCCRNLSFVTTEEFLELIQMDGTASGKILSVRHTIKKIYTKRAFHNILRDYKHLLQENQRTYLDGIVHSHRKTEKVFFLFGQLEMFDVCTMGDIQVLAPHTLTRVWQELEYRIDVCRVTRGAHIEYL